MRIDTQFSGSIADNESDIAFRVHWACRTLSTPHAGGMKELGAYLSSKIGSSATAFNLNTLALASPESCDRMIMALSVFRLGRAPRVLSITSCALHQHVGLAKGIETHDKFTADTVY